MVNTMTNEYAAKVAKEITEMTGWRCEISEPSKNNVSLTGIIVHKDEDAFAHIVYVPDSVAYLTWDDLTENDIKDAAQEYIETINNTESGIEKINSIVTDKHEILKQVFFCLENRIWNNNSDLVSRSVGGDLQYIYKIDVSDIVGEGRMITLTKEHLVKSGLTEEELYIAALKNTPEKYPVSIEDITEILGGCTPIEGVPIYVISNNSRILGATAITYPGVAEELEDIFGDFYILPSSVHECIAIKAVNDNTKELCEMVRMINHDVVNPLEWLSDHIYKFDDGKLISIEE